MDAGECSNSKPCEPSASSPAAAGGVWAKLVPADSAYPEVEVAEDDTVVCALVAPAAGEELAWCEIRRAGDASSATISNLSSDAIIVDVDGRVIQQEAIDIKPGSEIVPGPKKEGHLVYTFDITAAKDHDQNNIKIVLDIENAKCSICLNLWHAVVTVAPCFHYFCPGAAHLHCNGYGGMMPARANTSIPQKYLGCDKAFCGAYWCSQGVNSSQYNLICNQETFRMLSQRHISRLPDTVHGGNPYEKDKDAYSNQAKRCKL